MERNDQEKNLIETYLDQYEISSSDADYIWEKVLAAFDVLKNSGKKKFQDMSAAEKASIVALAGEVDENTSIECAIVDGVFILYEPNTRRQNVFHKTPVYPIAQTNSGLLAAGLGVISVLGIALAFRKIKNA